MRTPGRRGIVAVALATLILVVGLAWVFPPLGSGNGGVASGPPGVDQGTDSDTGAAIITFVPSGRVAFGVEVRNTTFQPVTIDGLREGDAVGFLLDDTYLVLGTDPTYLGLEDDHVRPFEAITLAPNATQLIGVIGQFPDCAHARPNWATGSVVTISSLRFSVRIAGLLPAEATVPLLIPVELTGDVEAACPSDRTAVAPRTPLIFSSVLLSRP